MEVLGSSPRWPTNRPRDVECEHSEIRWLTKFVPAGYEIHAHPEPGVDLVEQMHDLAHLIVNAAANMPESEALARAAMIQADKPLPADDRSVCFEETFVAKFQDAVRAYLDWQRALGA